MFQTIQRIGLALIKKSERYTKTDMLYLIKGGGWLASGQIFFSLLSLASSIAFANLLPKETFGEYKYILSLIALLSVPTLSGMNTAITQAVARGHEGSFLSAIKTRVLWGIIGALLSVGVAGYYFLQGNISFAVIFLIVAVFIPFLDPLGSFDALLAGRKDFRASAQNAVITQAISVASMILVILLTKDIIFMVLSYLFSNTLVRGFFFFHIRHTIAKDASEDPTTLSYGKHLSVMNVLGIIATYIDKILVFHFLGAVELAIYTFATIFPDQIKTLLKYIGILALPKFSNKKQLVLKEMTPHYLLIFSLFSFFICLITILIIPFLFKIFFPTYITSILYAQWYAIILLFTPKILFRVAWEAQKNKKELYIFQAFSAVTLTCFMFVFIWKAGIMGAIIAEIIAEAILSLFLAYRFFRKHSSF